MGVFQRTLAVLAMIGMAGPASAQAGDPQAAPATDLSHQGGTLSDKLSGTDGVIHPQGGVDQGMQKTPPAESRMPVIPPAGAAGGAQGGVAK